MQKIIKQLQIHIRARYPVLYLLSFEEGRLQKLIEHVAKQESLELCFWRRTTGLELSGEQLPDTAEARDALKVF